MREDIELALMSITETKSTADAIAPPEGVKNAAKFYDWRVGLIVFALALFVRLIYMLQVKNCILFLHPTVDAYAYFDYASHYANGEWLYPPGDVYWQPPFYSMFLGALMNAVGSEVLWLKAAQFIIGSVNCVLVYMLGARVFNKRVGLIAGIAAALYGPMIYFDGEFLTPPLQIFLNLCFVLVLYSAVGRKSVMLSGLAGLLLGLSIVTRPDVAGFGAAAVLWMALVLRKELELRRLAVLCGVMILFAVAPAQIMHLRNIVVGSDDVTISYNGGINFFIGNNEHADVTQAIRPGPPWDWFSTIPKRTNPSIKSSELNAWFYDQAIQWAKHNPIGYLRLQTKKMAQYMTAVEGRRNHDLYFYRQYSPLFSALVFKIGTFAFPFGLLFPLAVVGMLRCKRRPEITLLYAYLALQCLATVAFFVCARYRMTIIPVLLPFAVFGVMELWRIGKEKQWRDAAPVISLAVAALIFTNGNICHIDADSKVTASEEHLYMGTLQSDEHHPALARAEYNKALSLDPKAQLVYYYLCRMSIAEGKQAKAGDLARAALRVDPNIGWANQQFGTLLATIGDLSGALKCFETADSKDPWSYPFLTDLATQATEKGDSLLALKAMEAVVKQRPDMTEARDRVRCLRALLEMERGSKQKPVQ